MKKNLNLGSGWLGLGAALMALMATSAVSCAQSVDVLSDLGETLKSTAVNANQYKAEGFTLAGTGTFTINQIILGLAFSGVTTSADVYLETASGTGVPSINLATPGSGYFIGTVGGSSIGTSSGGATEYNVTLSSPISLSAGVDYALIIDTSGNQGGSAGAVGWQYFTTSSGIYTTATGSYLGAWNHQNTPAPNGSWVNTQANTQVRYMDLVEVPEPSTQALMVLGAAGLLISVRRQRRKNLKPTV
jgi:hypothetical protein